MRISSKGRYAVRILSELAKNEDKLLSASEISASQSISLKYLEQILKLLLNARIVESVRGAHGGYRLLKVPSQISVSEVLKITDDLPKLAPCLQNHKCERMSECESIDCWQRLSFLINDYLEKITIAELAKK